MRRQVNADNFLSRHSYADIHQAAMILGVTRYELERMIRRGEVTVQRGEHGKRYFLKSHLKAVYEQRLQGR